MAKEKKKITDFQKALQNNVAQALGSNREDINESEEANETVIDPKILSQFQQLSNKYKVDRDKLIGIALQHFLDREQDWFGERKNLKQ